MKKVFLIICILVILVLVALCGYLVNERTKYVASTSSDFVESNKESEINVEPLGDKWNDDVRRLYCIVENHNFGYEMEPNLYQSKKVTYEDLTNEQKLLTIFNYAFNWGYDIDNRAVHGWGDITLEDVEEINKKVFGPNSTIEYDNVDGSMMFTLKGDRYESEIDNSKTKDITDPKEFLFAEKIGDKVYIFDKYIRIYGRTYNAKSTSIYASSDKNIVIDDSITTTELSELVSRYIPSEEFPMDLDEEMLAIEAAYHDKVLTYMHVFQDDGEGNYYWISSEPIIK